MNMTPSEGAAFALQLKDALKDSKTKVMVAPPFVTIPAVMSVLKDSNIMSAQNMSDVRSGAHTWEVSVLMLKDPGVPPSSSAIVSGALYAEMMRSTTALSSWPWRKGGPLHGETLAERRADSWRS